MLTSDGFFFQNSRASPWCSGKPRAFKEMHASQYDCGDSSSVGRWLKVLHIRYHLLLFGKPIFKMQMKLEHSKMLWKF